MSSSGGDVSEEEYDKDGGAAIPPPAKRKVRGKEIHLLNHHDCFQVIVMCPGIVCYPL